MSRPWAKSAWDAMDVIRMDPVECLDLRGVPLSPVNRGCQRCYFTLASSRITRLLLSIYMVRIPCEVDIRADILLLFSLL